jgi:hypothetical protein
MVGNSTCHPPEPLYKAKEAAPAIIAIMNIAKVII